jgi:AcrR family transcriptional regulator
MNFDCYFIYLITPMSELKIETWTKAGYELLATEGLAGVKIERLARILSLNKSGFYYYFGTMEGFLKHVLQYHIRMAGAVATEIARCETIDPDLLHLIIRQRTFFLVESQLLVKSSHAHADHDVDEAGKIITKELISLWRRIGDAPEEESVVYAYFNIIRHFFYARIDPDNINYTFLHGLAEETNEVLKKMPISRHVSSRDAD